MTLEKYWIHELLWKWMDLEQTNTHSNKHIIFNEYGKMRNERYTTIVVHFWSISGQINEIEYLKDVNRQIWDEEQFNVKEHIETKSLISKNKIHLKGQDGG